MKKRKYMQKLISIFLTGMMLIQTPLTTLASDVDIFTDEIEENLPDNEKQQEIFDSGTGEAVEEETVQESFSDDISESIEFGEEENISENFEQLNEIEDKFEAAAATADLMVGNYKCAINGNKITIIRYSGTDENIVVPNSLGGYEVTAIGDAAFANCANLKTIILPEGLKSIGYSFISGTSVTSLTIPKTVTESGHHWSGSGAIDGAASLKSVVFEEGMERIPDYICGNSRENGVLSEVRIPESVTEIGNEAFYNCISATIYGYSDSYAETYAKNKNISFIALKDKKTIDISKAKISGVQEVYEYTGITIKPVPKVTLNNKQLTEKKDYNISYKKNKNIGTATITITGKGNYSGLRIIEFRIINMENNIEKSAVSFANIFAKKAKNTNSTTTNAKQQLEDLGNQLTITGYKGTLPDEVLEAFATAVLNTIKDSNIDKYETNQNKLANQIYAQIKGGLKSGSKKIILGNGSKKITYTVNYKIFAQSFGGIGAQVSWANVEWKDAKNKSYSVHIVANSKNENMKKALASYCAVLAQLNKDVWKEFLTKYITDGWKLAGLNTVKKLDDKTVSKFFDRSEKLILTICGDQNAKKALVNDAGNTLKEKLLKMSKAQFRNFIKNNIPDGDKIIAAADQYKKVIDKYNDYKKKFNKWNKTRKDSDLAKYEKAYLECQVLLEVLNDSLSKVS